MTGGLEWSGDRRAIAQQSAAVVGGLTEESDTQAKRGVGAERYIGYWNSLWGR